MTELQELLAAFIAFRSVGRDTTVKGDCMQWIRKTFLANAPVEPVTGEVNSSPYLLLLHPDPKLLWFGHTDVVPASDDQFTLRVDGDRAYGRGVKDMKGADLAFLIAYRDAINSGKNPPVSILLTSDEETGGHTPPALLERKALGTPPVAFTPDTGETDGIVTELKGALWARLVAEGKGGHSAYPWKSENPVPKLFEGIRILQEKFPPGDDSDWFVTVTPTQLRGSDAMNRIADEVSCTLDIRFPPSIIATPEKALSVISASLPAGFRVEQVEFADPMYCSPDHPMVQTIRRIAQDVTGAPVPIRRECGSSDARAFTARGIPAFLYGPTGGDLHGATEWVSMKSLEEQVEINRRLLTELGS